MRKRSSSVGGVRRSVSSDDSMTLAESFAWLARDRDAAWVALQALAHARVAGLSRRWRLQRADVEEVGDVVFLRIIDEDFAVLRRGDPAAPLAAWVTGVAKNVLRERRRVEARLRVKPLADADAATDDDDSDSAPSSRRARRLSLHHLPPTQRAVMVRLKEGVSERRIAALLGVTMSREKLAMLPVTPAPLLASSNT